jgi:hypothetical protein
MRYNPPPNWPEPPEGWVPPREWSPDPSWPPPPPGWKLWVDDAPAPHPTKPVLDRLKGTGEDEYFGDDRAWSADADQARPQQQLTAEPAASTQEPTEVAPDDLSAHHLGRNVTIRWDDEHRYDIGTIVAVSADSEVVSVKLAELETPVSFLRKVQRRGPANPRLYVWI